MAADADWSGLVLGAATSLLSGVGGLAIGIWRWGRRSAIEAHRVKEDYESKIRSLDLRMEERVEMLVGQFKETLTGLRRQIDEDRLYTEQNFVRKDDFKEFREEYRDDMRELKTRIAEITRAK